MREPIVIAGNGGQRELRLTFSVQMFSEEKGPDGSKRLVPQQTQLLPETESIPALVLESGSSKRIVPLEAINLTARGRMMFWSEEPSRLPCVFVSPYGGERTANLGVLWDRIALSDSEKDVIEALRIIAPDIIAISMVGGERLRPARTAIVRSREYARPVPLRSYGDGLNRLFGIVLSLVNAKDGFLLIDEIENGLHHTVELDVWRVIFHLSKRLNVQVFATSHSWDAVETFQKAAAEDPAEGLLVRLSKKDEAIISTPFCKNELAVATRDHIEVR